MLNITKSSSLDPNANFQNVPRADEDNLAWFAKQLENDKTQVALILLGGVSAMSFRLRCAQAHLKHDLTPSRWSHVGLLFLDETPVQDALVYEISMEPWGGFGFPSPRNGLQRGALRHYSDPKLFPNVAIVSIPIAATDLRAALNTYMYQRVVLDATELIVLWLSFLWGAGRAPNPLLDGHPVPGASMVTFALSSVGFNLSAATERNSASPESIWQSLRWWYELSEIKDLKGTFNAPHQFVSEELW